MKLDNNHQAFFTLVKAGLWEQNILLSQFGQIDFNQMYRLAEEQSVVGLVAAGIEHVVDIKIPQQVALNFVGSALLLEQRNQAMNAFINDLLCKLRDADIYSLLVKGQGVAQCYERPLWRACGDIDLLLSINDYESAKELLIPLAVDVETEYTYFKHIGMTLQGWVVELHGTLQSRLSKKIDDEIDNIQEGVIRLRDVRVWQNGNTAVYLPAPDADVIFVFTHFLHHFFFEGVGLRQICDWCRLLWIYRDSINVPLLEKRLKKMHLMTEWKAFAAYAVNWLGMPIEAIPLYDKSGRWKKKALKINSFVLKVGNFGYNQGRAITSKQPYLLRKFLSFWVHAGFTLRHFLIFPKDSIVFFGQVFRSGLHAAVKGE